MRLLRRRAGRLAWRLLGRLIDRLERGAVGDQREYFGRLRRAVDDACARL